MKWETAKTETIEREIVMEGRWRRDDDAPPLTTDARIHMLRRPGYVSVSGSFTQGGQQSGFYFSLDPAAAAELGRHLIDLSSPTSVAGG